MYEHHQAAINALVDKFKDEPRIPAIVIGGSIARKRALANSDVDIFLIVTKEEWAQCQIHNRYFYFNRAICNYPDGYIDGKIMDLEFLKDIAEHGSEPARSAFIGSFVAYSRIPELDDLIHQIPIYPERERQEKLRAFFAQVEAIRYFVRQAEKRNDPYLMTHVASDLTLYAGRMILTYNRILFPGHKWFLEEVEAAPLQPDGFMGHIRAMLAQPSREQVEKVCACLYSFTEWEKPPQGWVARFLEDSEWNWRKGRISPAEW